MKISADFYTLLSLTFHILLIITAFLMMSPYSGETDFACVVNWLYIKNALNICSKYAFVNVYQAMCYLLIANGECVYKTIFRRRTWMPLAEKHFIFQVSISQTPV